MGGIRGQPSAKWLLKACSYLNGPREPIMDQQNKTSKIKEPPNKIKAMINNAMHRIRVR